LPHHQETCGDQTAPSYPLQARAPLAPRYHCSHPTQLGEGVPFRKSRNPFLPKPFPRSEIKAYHPSPPAVVFTALDSEDSGRRAAGLSARVLQEPLPDTGWNYPD
jgi:hypothetical protein